MLLRLVALGALGFAGYKLYEKSQADRTKPAFADNQRGATIRDAGPGAMRDKPARGWSAVDEADDESFPASDPPATY